MPLDISKLNSAQKQAVTFGKGPLMLVAGAGTGKTTVLANRIAWLIAEGRARSEELLAVTFTERAAQEMEERVDRLLPLGYVDVWIHTFHGFCQRVLTRHAIDIGLPDEFKLADTTTAWMLVRRTIDRFKLDYYKPLGNPTRFIHALIQHFSRCKDEGVYPEDYLAYAESLQLDSDRSHDHESASIEIARIREVADAYHTYQQVLLENNTIDFGDLINYTVKLFEKRAHIREQYRALFKYILVDEFQDTNWMQYKLVQQLAAPANNLTVVGDDDQSIYKFRGASFSNILMFVRDYPDAAQITLIENYRSGQGILDAAYAFIQQNNPDRLEVKLKDGAALAKKLVSRSAFEGEVAIMKYETADDEVRGVLEHILRLMDTAVDFSWSDVSILVRANEQAQRFVRALRSAGLPHRYLASKGLYAQDILLAILNYLKLLDNYHESEALYKVMSLPSWGIVGEDVVQLTHLATKKSWSLWQALARYAGNAELAPSSVAGIGRLLKLVLAHTDAAKRGAPSLMIYRFLEESGYLKYLTQLESDSSDDAQYSREQTFFLNQFFKKVRTWESEHLGEGVSDFIAYMRLELESGEAGSLENDAEEGPEAVTVSTIHSAKGLEYRYVFVATLAHLKFPTRQRKDAIELPAALIKDVLPEGDAHLQEERRLMYVALTRAKERVYLSYAEDYGGSTVRKPSQFLIELGFDTAKPYQAVTRDIVVSRSPNTSEDAIRYKLPRKFSFTQLRAFETCPKQYYYAHIIKIPSSGHATFTFGKTMHTTLERFFTAVKERSAQSQGTLFESGAPLASDIRKLVTKEELLGMYESAWNEDWFVSEEQKQTYKMRGVEILKKFYDSIDPVATAPVALEQPFNVKVGPYTIKGKIDRIDETTVEGRPMWNIIDYKTGKPPKDGDIVFKDKQQLLLYQIAAQEVFRRDVHALALHFLESNTLFEFAGTPRDIEKVRSWIIETIDAIRQSQFDATPDPFSCRSCDFKHICPFAQL